MIEDIHNQSLDDNLKLAASVFQASGAAMLILDANYNIINSNPAFTGSTGFSFVEIAGKPIEKIFDSSIHQTTHKEIIFHINNQGYWRGELYIYRKIDASFPAIILINSMKRFDGRISHYVALFLDISDQKQLEYDLRYHAEIDPLTGLPNRKLFFQHLDAAFATAKRFNYHLALLYLDLDGFKQVNDKLGHGQGDNVLIEVAKRLIFCVREVDTVARLGGDEFVIILNNTSKDMIAVTAQRIIDSLTLTVKEKGLELLVSASIGIAIFPNDSNSPQILLKYADEAMYRAKFKGKGQFCWHRNLSK